jgi:hypothetical protein
VLAGALTLVAQPASAVLPALADNEGARAIAYVGAMYDQTDLQRLRVGTAGYWFPNFEAATATDHASTRRGAVDALPAWTAPLNHYSVADPVTAATDQGCTPMDVAAGCVPTFFFRSFSQDGPAHSKGGQARWSRVVLPDGRRGLSGAIVDPHTAGARNNTVNRIQLHGAVPPVFYIHVLTDNTNGEHDPTRHLYARGNIGRLDSDLQVEPDRVPSCELTFNGTPDVHTFRFEGFSDGDYVKIALRGDDHGGGASFGGLLFDEVLEPAGPYRRAPRGGHAGSC